MAEQSKSLVMTPKTDLQNREKQLGMVKDRILAVGDKDFYSVGGGKTAPSSHLVREMAKLEDPPIKWELLDFGKNKKGAWAKIHAWKGDKDNPIVELEDGIHHDFELMLIESFFDVIANGIRLPAGNGMEKYYLTDNDWEIGTDGFPVILNRDVQFQILKNNFSHIKFAERDAITKCERRVLLKLMGKYHDEKREEEESPLPEPMAQREEQEPNTLEETQDAIRVVLLRIAGGNGAKAQELLGEISQVDEKWLAVRKPAEIFDINHAREILARARQKEIDTQKETR